MGVRAAIVSTALLVAAIADASPLEDTTFGGAVFTGPVHGHASAMFINPAGLGLTGRGWHLHLGGSLRVSSLSLDRRVIDAGSGQVSDGPSFSEHTLSPGGIAAWYASFGNDAHFGLSLYAPNSEIFPGGEEIRYHSLGGHMGQGLLTLAGSYRFAGRVIFGLGFSLGYTTAHYDFARDTATAAGSDPERGIGSDCGGGPCGFENPAADQIYRIEADSADGIGGFFALRNVAASVGLAVRVHDRTWVALSYAGLPGAFDQLELDGTARVTAAPRDGGAASSGEAELTLRAPHTVYAGVRHPVLPGYDLIGIVRWQDLSRHDQLDLRLFGGELDPAQVPEWYPRYRGFSDVVRVGVGLEGDPSERLRLGARLRAETGAVDAERATPIQMDGVNATLALGAELRFAEHFVFGAGYGLTWFSPLDAETSAFDPRDRVDCIDSQYDFDRCQAAREGRALPTAAGSYRRLLHGFILSLRYDSL